MSGPGGGINSGLDSGLDGGLGYGLGHGLGHGLGNNGAGGASGARGASAPSGCDVALYLPHLRTGGAELSMLRLAAGFAAAGLAVDLIVHTMTGAEVPPPAGVRVTDLQSHTTLGSVLRLASALRRLRPQSLLSAFPHSNVAAVAARAWSGVDCACVVSEHAPLSHQIASHRSGWRYRVLPPLVRWAYRRADAVVAVSDGVRADLARLVGPGLRLHTIANPVLDAAGLFSSASAAPGSTPLHRWLQDPQLQVVLSVSRLSVEKDLPTLLHAFADLHRRQPHTRLLMAGDGPQRDALQALIHQLGLASVAALPGRIAGPRHWMARAAVFALASRFEGFGNVLVEALASNTPVVATDCPVGPREILAGGRWGALVPVGDWQAMADALAQALDQRGAPAGAQAHVARFTDVAACDAYRRLLADLADPADPAAARRPLRRRVA